MLPAYKRSVSGGVRKTGLPHIFQKPGGITFMNKKERQAEASKKANQKKIMIGVFILVVAVIAALIVFSAYQQNQTRIFTDGHQNVILYPNGSFAAVLAHESEKGTYTENTADGVTTVTFISEGVAADGRIINNILTLPEEWDDGHGHGMNLRLK